MLAKAARTRIALADNGKFGKQCFAYVGPATDIDILVTDAGTSPSYIKELRDAGLQVVIAESGQPITKAKDRSHKIKKN